MSQEYIDYDGRVSVTRAFYKFGNYFTPTPFYIVKSNLNGEIVDVDIIFLKFRAIRFAKGEMFIRLQAIIVQRQAEEWLKSD